MIDSEKVRIHFLDAWEQLGKFEILSSSGKMRFLAGTVRLVGHLSGCQVPQLFPQNKKSSGSRESIWESPAAPPAPNASPIFRNHLGIGCLTQGTMGIPFVVLGHAAADQSFYLLGSVLLILVSLYVFILCLKSKKRELLIEEKDKS